MKTIYVNNYRSRLLQSIKYSDKSYKIIGLKCQPEELPESLLFLTAENMFFRIPYIANQNLIIELGLQKNIMMVGKVLSYFELEEVDELPIVSNVNHKFNKIVEPEVEVSNYIKADLLKKFAKGFESSFSKRKYEVLESKEILKIIPKKDFDKYYIYTSNVQPIDHFIETIVLNPGSPELVKAMPKSIFNMFMQLLENSESMINYAYKNFFDNIYPDSTLVQIYRNPATEFLTSLLELTDGNKDKWSNKIDTNEANEKSFTELISGMLDKNFKFDRTPESLEQNLFKVFSYRDNLNCTNTQTWEGTFTFQVTDTSNFNSYLKSEGFYSAFSYMFKDVDFIKNALESKEKSCVIPYFAYSLMFDLCSTISNAINNNKLETNKLVTIKNYEFIANLSPEGTTIESLHAKYKDMINLTWSDELTRAVKFSTKDLEESIRHRYFFPTSVGITNYIDQRNLVVDTILPQTMFQSNLNLERTLRAFKISQNINVKTAYAISPLTAAAFGCKQINIEHLVRILGYTKDSIKTMLNKVKEREYNLVLVGAGGTGNNTTIWLSQFADMCNMPYVFNKIRVFEKESAEIHNLLRFPKDPYSITIDSAIFANNSETLDKNKCNIIAQELRNLSKEVPTCYENYIANDNTNNAYPVSIFSITSETEPILNDKGETIDFATVTKIKPRPNTIFYGAPDITTRQNLSNIGNFISATHSSNNCSIYINPEQDAMIQVESYGMIQLSTFFMNQIRMAIGLLEILSADNAVELLAKKDYEFMTYEFNGESVLKNDRVYNFKIIENPEMATQDQANQDVGF